MPLDLVYELDAPDPPDADDWVAVLARLASSEADLLLVGADRLGLEVGPRVAERISAGYAPWATSIAPGSDGSIVAECVSYGGAAITTLAFREGPVVASMLPTPSQEAEGLTPPVERIPAAASGARLQRGGAERRQRGGGLEHASALVDIGQGIRDHADIATIEHLAGLLDAQIACSRPLAADREWFGEWVGLSGAKVHPVLCVAVGISGAIQHVVGIRGSKTIVAVNSDESAPIHDESDYAVVCDLYEFIPALADRLEARGVRPAWSG